MKKIITISMTALTLGLGLGSSVTANAKGWYVGAGAGGVSTRQGTTLSQYEAGGAGRTEQGKQTTSNQNFQGSIFAGHVFEATSFDWFFQANGLMDNTKLRKTFISDGTVGTRGVSESTIQIQRRGTFSVDFGITKSVKNVDVSLKLGAVVSRFQSKINTPVGGPVFSSEKTSYLLGVVPGVSFGKAVGPVVLGLDYSYQIYGQLKSETVQKSRGLLNNVVTSPRYQSLMLTVKKSF